MLEGGRASDTFSAEVWVRDRLRQGGDKGMPGKSLRPWKSGGNGDSVQSAAAAGLRYVSDHMPGIRREPRKEGFAYFRPDGKPVREPVVLDRIKRLAIPPAWKDVWICPIANGHLQATGHDAKGRKQYRYHPEWRRVRDETKFSKLVAFGRALPKIRRVTREHLSLPGLPREKVLATVVQLLERTLIRIGNEEYAKTNHSFGLTTMRDKHVAISGQKIHFEFRGKSNKYHSIDLEDPRLARTIKRCRDLPGYELFQYVDEDGNRQVVHSDDINRYIKEITGEDFTAKDFRTWFGSVLATKAFHATGPFRSASQAKRNVNQAMDAVAQLLGNTRAICRKCYVHPAAVEAYLGGRFFEEMKRRKAAKKPVDGLRPDELAMLDVVQRCCVE